MVSELQQQKLQQERRRPLRPLSNGHQRHQLPSLYSNSPSIVASHRQSRDVFLNSPSRAINNSSTKNSGGGGVGGDQPMRLPSTKPPPQLSPRSTYVRNNPLLQNAQFSPSKSQIPSVASISQQSQGTAASPQKNESQANHRGPLDSTDATTGNSGVIQSQNDANKTGEENLKELLEIFNKYDTQQIGLIALSSLPAVLADLKQETTIISHESESDQPQPHSTNASTGPSSTTIIERYRGYAKTKDGYLSFDELLSIISAEQILREQKQSAKNLSYPQPQTSSLLLQQQQQQQQHSQSNAQLKFDSKVLEFLRMLNEFRRKCEAEGNYSDARKAHEKILEIKKKEQLRQKNVLRLLQESELKDLDEFHRSSLDEFAKTWDNYIAEYEATAYLSLEKMKERHQAEIESFVQELKEEFMSKMKASKQLITLRHKEKLLVKMKQYSEAEAIKAKADMLQEQENFKNQIEIKEKIELRVTTLRKTQTQVMQVLMKRIQTDRKQFAQQRQQDSIQHDLLHKQQAEVKRAMDSLKENLNTQDDEDVSNIAPGNSQQTVNPAEVNSANTATAGNGSHENYYVDTSKMFAQSGGTARRRLNSQKPRSTSNEPSF